MSNLNHTFQIVWTCWQLILLQLQTSDGDEPSSLCRRWVKQLRDRLCLFCRWLPWWSGALVFLKNALKYGSVLRTYSHVLLKLCVTVGLTPDLSHVEVSSHRYLTKSFSKICFAIFAGPWSNRLKLSESMRKAVVLNSH